MAAAVASTASGLYSRLNRSSTRGFLACFVISSAGRLAQQCRGGGTIVVAGLGFFTDAYDLFWISLVTKKSRSPPPSSSSSPTRSFAAAALPPPWLSRARSLAGRYAGAFGFGSGERDEDRTGGDSMLLFDRCSFCARRSRRGKASNPHALASCVIEDTCCCCSVIETGAFRSGWLLGRLGYNCH